MASRSIPGLLDADGKILDDIIVYRRAWDRYMVVVNAANFDKDWAWLNAVNRNEVVIDRDRPWVEVLHPVSLEQSQGCRQRLGAANGHCFARPCLARDPAGLRGRSERFARNWPAWSARGLSRASWATSR